MDLQTQIDELKARLDAMDASFTFPKPVSDALAERLGVGVIANGTGTPNASTSYGSFPVTVPAAPSSTLKVLYQGNVIELLVK